MKADQIRATDAQARARFTYKDDGPKDTWRSHADEVAAGDAWAGDCDDLASTVLDLLTRNGLPLNEAFRLLLSSTGGQTVDHMAACVVDDGGQFWIVGDTASPAYVHGEMRETGLFFNRLNEAGNDPVWRAGMPWNVKP